MRIEHFLILVGAFEKPVSGTNGYLNESESRFKEYAANIYQKFACAPEKTWEFGEKNFLQILKEIESAVKGKLSESGGE